MRRAEAERRAMAGPVEPSAGELHDRIDRACGMLEEWRRRSARRWWQYDKVLQVLRPDMVLPKRRRPMKQLEEFPPNSA